jgi:malate dehydrogenase
MNTVAIIGAGDIAGAAAQALARRASVHRILLIDATAQAAAGKALDIQQSAGVAAFHVRLDGTDEIDRAAGCSACVIADRFGASDDDWGEEGLAMVSRLAGFVGETPLVFAGASQAELLARAARELHIPRERLIGSSPEALVSAIIAIVAMEADCSPREILLTVLGAPPAGFVVPWNEASVSGFALEHVLSQVQLSRIEARATRLWPPGPYSLGAAAAQVTAALLSSSRRWWSVLTPLGGEFGVRGLVGALPARLTPRGIERTRVPELNARTHVQLQSALTG